MAEAVRASLMLLSLLKRGTPVWPSCMASHWLGGSPPHTELLPVPRTACRQLSDTHRNWSAFVKLTDVITRRNMGGNLETNSKFSWSPSHPDDLREMFQKAYVAHRRLNRHVGK